MIIQHFSPYFDDHANVEADMHPRHIGCQRIDNFVRIALITIELQRMARLKAVGAERPGVIRDKLIIELLSPFVVPCRSIIVALFSHVRNTEMPALLEIGHGYYSSCADV